MPHPRPSLPSLAEQAEHLIHLGLPELTGLAPEVLRRAAPTHSAPGGLLVLHPSHAPASLLAPLLERDGKSGFIVVDMPDVDDFRPIESITIPDGPTYIAAGIDRGDDYANFSPNEALPALAGAGRSPATLTEGLHWLLQAPHMLERNHCFMTIGSRLMKPSGRLDARTPALWISNGTGRDGATHRHAPKVGWCWAGNRHTWLGFASLVGRAEA